MGFCCFRKKLGIYIGVNSMYLGTRYCRAIFYILCLIATPAFSKQTIYIGAGQTNSIYATVAFALCNIIEEDAILQKDYDCEVVHTSSSLANLQGLSSKRLHLAIAQANTLQHAIRGTGHFTHGGGDPHLGILFPLYPESLSILVTQKSHMTQLDDLRHKNINIGKPFADQRASIELLMRSRGLSRGDFESFHEEDNQQVLLQQLCSGKIDAAIVMTGHPVSQYKSLMDSCELGLVSLDDNLISQVLQHETLLFPIEIASSIYNADDTYAKTFAGMAYLVAEPDLDPYFTHNLLVAVEREEKKLQASHPAMRQFSIAQTPYVKQLPLHLATKIYFGIPEDYD